MVLTGGDSPAETFSRPGLFPVSPSPRRRREKILVVRSVAIRLADFRDIIEAGGVFRLKLFLVTDAGSPGDNSPARRGSAPS